MPERKYSGKEGKMRLFEDLKKGSKKTKTDTSSRSGFSDLKKKKKKKVRFGVGSNKIIERNGKKFANVTADQLKKTGLSQDAYMKMWDKTGKRPTTMGTVKKVDSPVRRKDTPMSKKDTRKLGLTGDRTKLKKVDSPVDRPLGKGEMRKAVSKTISDRRKAELRSRKQPVMAGGVTRGPRSGDKIDQPVRAGRVTRGPRSGDKIDQPVRAGRVTRGPRSGDTSGQPVKAGSVRDAREARHPQSQYRKMMREASRKKDKKAGGGMIKKTGMRGGGMVKKTGMRGGGMVKKTGMKKGGMVKKTGMRKKSIDGIARKGKTRGRNR